MKFTGLNPGWGKVFHTCPAWPWGQPSLFCNGYQVFLGEGGVNRPGHGIDHPPSSSIEFKERAELYLYSPSGPLWPVLVWTLPFTFTFIWGSLLFNHRFLFIIYYTLPKHTVYCKLMWSLTIYLLMWRMWWAPNNASKGQMGFNLAFKGLMCFQRVQHYVNTIMFMIYCLILFFFFFSYF